MKAYKGFNRDMTCRGFQFEEGKEYHEEKAELCESGFHACENPLDTFNYYYPRNSVFHEVELGEVSDERNDDDTKICAKTIRVGARLDVVGLCKARFEYVSARCKPANGRVAGDKESAAAGEQGLACCRGGKVKGGTGAVIVASELDGYGKNIRVAAAIVDGEKIKSDTWYTVKNGEFVEVNEK